MNWARRLKRVFGIVCVSSRKRWAVLRAPRAARVRRARCALDNYPHPPLLLGDGDDSAVGTECVVVGEQNQRFD
jgi:hypothetical protein